LFSISLSKWLAKRTGCEMSGCSVEGEVEHRRSIIELFDVYSMLGVMQQWKRMTSARVLFSRRWSFNYARFSTSTPTKRKSSRSPINVLTLMQIKSNANLYGAIYDHKRTRGAGAGTRPDRLR